MDLAAVVGVGAGGVDLGGYGHGGGGEVLHLLEAEAEVFGLECEFGHVLWAGSGVAADEVGDDGGVRFAGFLGGGIELFFEFV